MDPGLLTTAAQNMNVVSITYYRLFFIKCIYQTIFKYAINVFFDIVCRECEEDTTVCNECQQRKETVDDCECSHFSCEAKGVCRFNGTDKLVRPHIEKHSLGLISK